MDSWYSSKEQVPRQMRAKASTPKPLDNLSIVPTSTSTVLEAMRETSLWAILLPLTDLHSEVVNINYKKGGRKNNTARMVLIQHLENRLDDWLQTLPSHLRNTTENLDAYRTQGRLRQFAVIHIIYHHECQQLYFQFLNGRNTLGNEDYDAEVSTYIARCKGHATALSELMWLGHTIPDEEFLWSPVNGHLLGIASTIHLHTLLSETNERAVLEARRLLEQNFVLLLRLSEYWPTLENTMSRLRAIHAACSASDPSRTFNAQSWTSNFLNKFDVPITEEYIASAVGTQIVTTTAEPPSSMAIWDALSRRGSPSDPWSPMRHLWQDDSRSPDSTLPHLFSAFDVEDLT